MCFSAGASFAVGASLIVPGVYAIKRTTSPGMVAFSSTILLLSFHQIAEGFIWLSLKNPDFASWYKFALYGYSFISQPVWPVWVPLIIWLMETDPKRKKILSYFFIGGLAAALYMGYCLVAYNISAVAENGHIRYYRDFPYLNIMRPINFITIAVTPFLSTLPRTKLLASAMMASLIVSYLFFTNYLISVWCFFAAILSLLIILVINANRKTVTPPSQAL
jgi:hypothetical protein